MSHTKKLILNFISLIFLSPFSSSADQAPPYSAYRNPGHSYLEYIPRSKGYQSNSALDSARAYNELDLSNIPNWEDSESLKTAFESVRNIRFLTTADRPKFLRRASWLYPDDGCFARAQLMNINFRDWKYQIIPAKVFVFGDLEVKTPNHPRGSVSWWYHVAPIIQVADIPYVLDPAIDPKSPQRLDQWILKQVNDLADVKVALCSSSTYEPSESCDSTTFGDETALRDQGYYLEYEWDRLLELERDPELELGDRPPWNFLIF